MLIVPVPAPVPPPRAEPEPVLETEPAGEAEAAQKSGLPADSSPTSDTQPTPDAEPKPDADKNLAIQFLRLLAPAEVAADYETRLRAGGLGYGDLKKGLFEHYWNYFAAARARRAELAANLDHVESVLRDGAARARNVAAKVLARARQASGLE